MEFTKFRWLELAIYAVPAALLVVWVAEANPSMLWLVLVFVGLGALLLVVYLRRLRGWVDDEEVLPIPIFGGLGEIEVTDAGPDADRAPAVGSLGRVSPKCGFPPDPTDVECPRCGADLGPPVAPVPPAPPLAGDPNL
ncbi:MAG: hypothetical protein ACLPZM_04370 [Thermoplasmata archaeon]